MTDYRFEYIKNQMIGEILMEQQKSKILMEQQKSNDEKIRQLKEDIAINKEKLQKLEELQRTKSPVEEAFKKVFSHYPNEKDFREGIWFGFEKGYNALHVIETPQEPEEWDIKVETDYLTGKARHKWNIVDKDGNDYKPTPQEEPKELKTLYQMFYDEKWTKSGCDEFCDIVKNWLPTERVENKYDADYNSGWNDLLDTLRRTLR